MNISEIEEKKNDLLELPWYTEQLGTRDPVYQPFLVPRDCLPNDPCLIIDTLADELQNTVLPNPSLHLNMGMWVSYAEYKSGDYVCYICLAGVLMICRLHAPIRLNGVRLPLGADEVDPTMYAPEIIRLLHAVDSYRLGDLKPLLRETTNCSKKKRFSISRAFSTAYLSMWEPANFDDFCQDQKYHLGRGAISNENIPLLIEQLRWSSIWLRDHCDLT